MGEMNAGACKRAKNGLEGGFRENSRVEQKILRTRNMTNITVHIHRDHVSTEMALKTKFETGFTARNAKNR